MTADHPLATTIALSTLAVENAILCGRRADRVSITITDGEITGVRVYGANPREWPHLDWTTGAARLAATADHPAATLFPR